MNLDLRILAVTTCLAVIAASAVVVSKFNEMRKYTPNIEIIAPSGKASAGTALDGLQLDISSNGITLGVPNCNTKEFTDKFFLHIYADGIRKSSSNDFVGMDFDLADDVKNNATPNKDGMCIVHKSFAGFDVKKIGIGQFVVPNGKCCEVVWSRFYLLKSTLISK